MQHEVVDLFGDIGLGLGLVNVFQNVVIVFLRHQLKTKNSIFGQVHIGGEDACFLEVPFLDRALVVFVVVPLDTVLLVFKLGRRLQRLVVKQPVLGVLRRAQLVVLLRLLLLEGGHLGGLVQVFTLEVLFKRTLTVNVQKGVPAVSRERTRQHRNEAKHRLHRLIQDVGNLIFEVLRCHEGVGEQLSPRAQGGLHFPTRPGDVRVTERPPEVEERVLRRLGTTIQQHDYSRVDDGAERLERPSVRVNLPRVAFLQAEHQLDGGQVVVQVHTFVDGVDAHGGGVLVQVGLDLAVVDLGLSIPFLEQT